LPIGISGLSPSGASCQRKNRMSPGANLSKVSPLSSAEAKMLASE